jgi:hypothetical protein
MIGAMMTLGSEDGELPPIIQVDTDAAVEWFWPRQSEWQGLLAQQFANHRELERKAIAAFLRSFGYEQPARAIENGEHWK